MKCCDVSGDAHSLAMHSVVGFGENACTEVRLGEPNDWEYAVRRNLT
jgi:hypothetical protein